MGKKRANTTTHWRAYERAAIAHAAEDLGVGLDLTATANAKLKGRLSGVSRQVDLLVEGRSDAIQHERTIVDAKRYGRRLNVKDIEAFEGMMRDCGASCGVLVCPNRWSIGAKRRAGDQITLIELPIDDDWHPNSHAEYSNCEGPCRGLVLWDGQLLLTIDNMYAIVYTGKCDTCRSFHVWCWDCGDVFALQMGEQIVCNCDRVWITMNSENEPRSEQLNGSSDLLIMLWDGDPFLINRRSRS